MRVLICGSGVIGLTTAIELHERFAEQVEIIVTSGTGEGGERHQVPLRDTNGATDTQTCQVGGTADALSFGRPVSLLAGGLIHPYTLGHQNDATAVGIMMALSLRRWSSLLDSTLLHWVPAVETVFSGDAQRAADRRRRLAHGAPLAGDQSLQAAPARWAATAGDHARWRSRCFREERGVAVSPAGTVESYTKQSWLAPVLQTPDVLALLRRTVASFATMVELDSPLRSRADVQALATRYGARYVIACLGMGTSCLLPEEPLTGRGGQVLRVRFRRPVPPATVLEYAADGATRYAIAWPNGEWIIGGTNTETGEDPAEYDKILAHFREKWGDLDEIARGYGERPYSAKLCTSWLPGTNIVVNSGHGGSGWTIPWATAQLAVDRIDEAEQRRARL